MKLRRLLLRYYPPGLIVECERSDGTLLNKTIDLLDLSTRSDPVLLPPPFLSSFDHIVSRLLFSSHLLCFSAVVPISTCAPVRSSPANPF